MYIPFLTIFYISGVLASTLNFPCKVSDTSCIEKIANNLHKAMSSGIPLLGVASLDPLAVKEIQGDLPALKFRFYDGSFFGYTNCILSNLKINEDITTVHYDMKCPKISLRSKYEMRGQLVSIDADGKGNFESTAENYVFHVESDINKIKGFLGKTHLAIKVNKFEGMPQGFVAIKFEDLSKNNNSVALNKLAKDNWRDVVNQLQEPVLEGFLNLVFNNVNKYLKIVALEDIKPIPFKLPI